MSDGVRKYLWRTIADIALKVGWMGRVGTVNFILSYHGKPQRVSDSQIRVLKGAEGTGHIYM